MTYAFRNRTTTVPKYANKNLHEIDTICHVMYAIQEVTNCCERACIIQHMHLQNMIAKCGHLTTLQVQLDVWNDLHKTENINAKTKLSNDYKWALKHTYIYIIAHNVQE